MREREGWRRGKEWASLLPSFIIFQLLPCGTDCKLLFIIQSLFLPFSNRGQTVLPFGVGRKVGDFFLSFQSVSIICAINKNVNRIDWIKELKSLFTQRKILYILLLYILFILKICVLINSYQSYQFLSVIPPPKKHMQISI